MERSTVTEWQQPKKIKKEFKEPDESGGRIVLDSHTVVTAAPQGKELHPCCGVLGRSSAPPPTKGKKR